jgi:O-antigen ligase
MSKTMKVLLAAVLILSGAMVIILANFLQQATIKMVIAAIFCLMALIIYFFFHEFKVIHYLYLSPLLFIRPMLEVNILYAAGLIIVFLFQQMQPPFSTKLRIPYSLFMILLLVAGIRAYLVGVSGAKALDFFFTEALLPPIVFLTIVNSSISMREIRKLLELHVYFAALLGIIGIALAILNPGERLGSLWSNAMTINGYYVLAFFIGIGLMEEAKGNRKTLLFVMIITILFGMIFTYTRIVLVGVVIGLFLMCLRKPALFKYMLFLLLLVPVLMPGGMMTRIKLTQSGDASILIRFLVWFYSAQMIIEHPIWGLGFDSFVVLYKNLLSIKTLRAVHSHNVYLKLLVEMGLVGFVGYMGILIGAVKRSYGNFKQTKGLSLHYLIWVALIVELIFCMTDVFIAQISVSLIFWILLGLVYNISCAKSIESDETAGFEQC